MDTLISVKNLSKKFGTLSAVKGVSFSVARGEVLGFLGPNGAGKSTTMRMATGYLIPTSGTASICGKDIINEPTEAKKFIGYLPEGGPLYNDMTPASFLDFIGKIRGLEGKKLEERVDFVAEKLQLNEVYYQTIDTLSKGFKRRVALAQAIIHDPDVLILDEPTDGLDPNQKHEVRKLIASMAQDKAIIISTHILEEVEAVCTKAIIIAKGKVLISGTPEEIAAKAPSHNSVVLKVKDYEAAKLKNEISNLDNINKIFLGDEESVIIYPKKARPIIMDIGRLAHEKGWEIDTLHAKTHELDEAFRFVTSASNNNNDISKKKTG